MGSPQSPLHALHDAGVSVWIDTLSRELVESGELARMVADDAVTGVTSNPSIFQKALADGELYDDQLRSIAETATDVEAFFSLAIEDIRGACDVLAPVFEATGGADGFVSLEVDPTLAYDREATFEQALALHAVAERPNLYVKIPATLPGLGAIEDCIAKGVAINVTLIFSLERYAAVLEAYVRGLERRAAAGGKLSDVSSVASFFVSRVDTEADRRLGELGRDDLQGRLAVANAKLAYEHWQGVVASERWQELAAKGGRAQRCLWASTSTKNPAYRDVLYVEELIGPETVNTMPTETLEAFRDHGAVQQTLTENVADAHVLLRDLAAAGLDYEDVVEVLEAEGVEKFSDSFAQLLAGLADRRAALR